MALVNCPECNKEVSDTALTCPHCGYQLKNREAQKLSPTSNIKKTNPGKATLIVFGAVALLFIIVMVIQNRTSPPEPTKPTTQTKVVSQYVKQYAGGYTIEVRGYKGMDIEAYALKDDGAATWMTIEPDGTGGAKTTSKKFGTWTATENSITTTIKGNSGNISETYVLQNGIFVNTISSDRYLKRTE